MRLNVFSCRDGFVLSADCMLVPLAAEMECGSISALLGTLDCTELPVDLCADIVAQLDARHYAIVTLGASKASNLRAFIQDSARIA
jgi:hypothetical protein